MPRKAARARISWLVPRFIKRRRMVEGRDTRGREKEKGTSFLTNRIGIGFEEGHLLHWRCQCGKGTEGVEGVAFPKHRRVPNRILGELSIPGEAFGSVRISFCLDGVWWLPAARRWRGGHDGTRAASSGRCKKVVARAGLPRFTNYSISPAN